MNTDTSFTILNNNNNNTDLFVIIIVFVLVWGFCYCLWFCLVLFGVFVIVFGFVWFCLVWFGSVVYAFPDNFIYVTANLFKFCKYFKAFSLLSSLNSRMGARILSIDLLTSSAFAKFTKSSE